jgi:hypothetical protein
VRFDRSIDEDDFSYRVALATAAGDQCIRDFDSMAPQVISQADARPRRRAHFRGS